MSIARTELHVAFHEALRMAGASGLVLGCTTLAEPEESLLQANSDLRTSSGLSGVVGLEPEFRPVECDGEPRPKPLYLGDLSPASAVDYLELRGGGGALESTGVACLGASDRDACRQQLTATGPSSSLLLGHVVQVLQYVQLVATRQGEVQRVTNPHELSAFLGEIDTAGEAQLLLASQDYSLVCGESGSVPRSGGFDVLGFTYEGCDGRTRHLLHVDRQGRVGLVDRFVERSPDPNCVVGRIPVGFRLPAGAGLRQSLARFFSSCAELEAASVHAFVHLARELTAHGAPQGFRQRAVVAAQDEVRHAKAVAALARSFGGKPRSVHVPLAPIRGLEQVALDNAREGCVRETYGALVAHHQKRATLLTSVARAYAPIAQDETRHSELSWDIARWAEPRLPSIARRRVSASRRRAGESLLAELGQAKPMPVDELVGLPGPKPGLEMAKQLSRRLWQ